MTRCFTGLIAIFVLLKTADAEPASSKAHQCAFNISLLYFSSGNGTSQQLFEFIRLHLDQMNIVKRNELIDVSIRFLKKKSSGAIPNGINHLVDAFTPKGGQVSMAKSEIVTALEPEILMLAHHVQSRKWLSDDTLQLLSWASDPDITESHHVVQIAALMSILTVKPRDRIAYRRLWNLRNTLINSRSAPNKPLIKMAEDFLLAAANAGNLEASQIQLVD